MYNLPYFKEDDAAVVLEFMKHHPFAMLIGCHANKAFATQIPLLFDERNGELFLLGHMMRKQDHQIALESNPQVLVVFTGPHTYVSATWYSNPHQASTWNYMSVHVRGAISFLDNTALDDVLRRLTLHYENNNASSSTVFDNLPDDYRSRLMKSIVAFEIHVHSIDNVFKLSQNRDRESYENIIPQLKAQGGDAETVANIMEHRGSKLFKDDVNHP